MTPAPLGEPLSGLKRPATAPPSTVLSSMSFFIMSISALTRNTHLAPAKSKQPFMIRYLEAVQALLSRKGRHVEGLHFRRIAIGRAIGAGVTVEATNGAAGLSVWPTDMRKASFIGKAIDCIRINRTGFQA